MASVFPGAIDSFTDPLSGSPLNSPSHSAQHADLNDAAEKLETYMGLVKVIPTSVSSVGGTSATLGATGTVTIGSANSSVTVNGAFSSLYDNYVIQYNNGVGNVSQAMYMALGASTTTYYSSLLYVAYATNAITANSINNGSNWYIGEATAASNTIMATIQNPFLSRYTHFSGAYAGTVAGSVNGYHATATSYSSFTISVSGTITGGTLRVYGYRN